MWFKKGQVLVYRIAVHLIDPLPFQKLKREKVPKIQEGPQINKIINWLKNKALLKEMLLKKKF